jgi:DNA-binding transcriptional ArsR family regulator
MADGDFDKGARADVCHDMRMRACHDGLQEDHVDLAVEVFRMLADATRVRLLWALLDGEVPVLQLAERVDKPQAAVSQHLAKLRMARLVTTRRQASQVFYQLANDHVRQLVVDGVHHAEHLGPGTPAHHTPSAVPDAKDAS